MAIFEGPDANRNIIIIVAVVVVVAIIYYLYTAGRLPDSEAPSPESRRGRPNLNFTAALISWPRVFSVLLRTKP